MVGANGAPLDELLGLLFVGEVGEEAFLLNENDDWEEDLEVWVHDGCRSNDRHTDWRFCIVDVSEIWISVAILREPDLISRDAMRHVK